MRHSWQKTLPAIWGREGEGEGGSSEGGEPSGEGPSNPSTNREGGSEGGDKNIDGLKSALDKERENNKELRQELRELKEFREKVEKEKQTELEQAQSEAEKAQERARTLESVVTRQAKDMALRRAAQEVALEDDDGNETIVRFVDPDDVLHLVDRSQIEVDEESYTVDTEAAETAVASLAENKPHLVTSVESGESSPPPSGSKFGGEKQTDSQADEESLRKKYPALG